MITSCKSLKPYFKLFKTCTQKCLNVIESYFAKGWIIDLTLFLLQTPFLFHPSVFIEGWFPTLQCTDSISTGQHCGASVSCTAYCTGYEAPSWAVASYDILSKIHKSISHYSCYLQDLMEQMLTWAEFYLPRSRNGCFYKHIDSKYSHDSTRCLHSGVLRADIITTECP